MSIATFSQFLFSARKYVNLIVDLCAESDLSRAKLFSYMERHAVPSSEKNSLIDELCKTAILSEETEDYYIVNPVVADLVNYYERRGRLTSATFLRDQIIGIAKLTDELQQRLFTEEKNKEAILDTVDNLYRLVREVREVGYNHYIACMRLLGDMKRTGDAKKVEQRLEDLENAQRRHINPLRELVDPTAEYAHKIQLLKRRVSDLSAEIELLAESQELDNYRRRLGIDLHYIDHTLLRNFERISDTARSLLKSLIEEKRIKDAIAACLGNLRVTWSYIKGQTVLAPGRQFTQSSASDTLEAFFADVLHHKLLPNPTSLSLSTPQKQSAETILISEERIWHSIAIAGTIKSWPEFVIATFRDYESEAQLQAIALPLIVSHSQVQMNDLKTPFTHAFNEFQIKMSDFGLTWKPENDDNFSSEKSRDLPKTPARLPV